MKCTALFVIIIMLSCLLSNGLLAQVKQAPITTGPPWMANVLEAKLSDGLELVHHAPRNLPPENQKWLNLTVELKPTDQKASLPVNQLKVVDDSSAVYTALAIECLVVRNQTHIFLFFEDAGKMTPADKPAELSISKGESKKIVVRGGIWTALFGMAGVPIASAFFEGGNPNRLIMTVNKDKTGEVALGFNKKSVRIALIFAVPATAKGFNFQIGDGTKVPVPLATTPVARN